MTGRHFFWALYCLIRCYLKWYGINVRSWCGNQVMGWVIGKFEDSGFYCSWRVTVYTCAWIIVNVEKFVQYSYGEQGNIQLKSFTMQLETRHSNFTFLKENNGHARMTKFLLVTIRVSIEDCFFETQKLMLDTVENECCTWWLCVNLRLS